MIYCKCTKFPNACRFPTTHLYVCTRRDSSQNGEIKNIYCENVRNDLSFLKARFQNFFNLLFGEMWYISVQKNGFWDFQMKLFVVGLVKPKILRSHFKKTISNWWRSFFNMSRFIIWLSVALTNEVKIFPILVAAPTLSIRWN